MLEHHLVEDLCVQLYHETIARQGPIMVLIMSAACICSYILQCYFCLIGSSVSFLGCCLVTSSTHLEAALGADAKWPRWGQQAEQASVRLAACLLNRFIFFL